MQIMQILLLLANNNSNNIIIENTSVHCIAGMGSSPVWKAVDIRCLVATNLESKLSCCLVLGPFP